MHTQSLVKSYQFVLKVLSGNEIDGRTDGMTNGVTDRQPKIQ